MLDQAKIIAIARARAVQNNWRFSEPLTVILRKSWLGKPLSMKIETNALVRGAKARFEIDVSSGEIISEGYIPR